MTEPHDPIDDLVRRANPVLSGEPLDPSLVSRAAARVEKERQMPASTRPTRRLRWSRRRGLAAALAAAAVGAIAFGLSAVVGGESASGPSVALGSPTASCLPFSEETLATFPVAFDGRVTSIGGERVTFDVEAWYRGGEGETVTVVASDLVAGAPALVGGIGFEEGERYLVSGDSQDGRIIPAVCGFTLTYSDEMADTFHRAFAG